MMKALESGESTLGVDPVSGETPSRRLPLCEVKMSLVWFVWLLHRSVLA